MELCFRLDTTFNKKSHKRKLKSDWTRLQSKLGKSILIGQTHTFELKVPLTPHKKSFYFQLNYRQLPPLSALKTLISTSLPSATPLSAFSCFYSCTHLLLKMIFSVQNSNLMYSVEFSPDLVQIQVRETVSGVFLARMDIPIQVWHMVEVMQRDFNEHHMTQVPMTENQLEEMQLMEDS